MDKLEQATLLFPLKKKKKIKHEDLIYSLFLGMEGT